MHTLIRTSRTVAPWRLPEDGTSQNLKLAEYWTQKGDKDEPQEVRDAINAQIDENRFSPYADALVSAFANTWAEDQREAEEQQRNFEESQERERQAQENERRDREAEPPR
jgi:hypothetical protein